MVNLREIDDRVWLETTMPPVFEKEYEEESQHPFSDTVLVFCLKRRSLRAGQSPLAENLPGTLKEGVRLL